MQRDIIQYSCSCNRPGKCNLLLYSDYVNFELFLFMVAEIQRRQDINNQGCMSDHDLVQTQPFREHPFQFWTYSSLWVLIYSLDKTFTGKVTKSKIIPGSDHVADWFSRYSQRKGASSHPTRRKRGLKTSTNKAMWCWVKTLNPHHH